MILSSRGAKRLLAVAVSVDSPATPRRATTYNWRNAFGGSFFCAPGQTPPLGPESPCSNWPLDIGPEMACIKGVLRRPLPLILIQLQSSLDPDRELVPDKADWTKRLRGRIPE